MISLASSFQRHQPHPVSITLPPINHRRTFASTKFQRTFRQHFLAKSWTYGANGHHLGVSLVELYTMMGSVTWIRRRLRRRPQLRWLLRNSGELLCRYRSSLAEGEHTITFVSSFPFFAVQSTVSWSFPSNPLCLLFLCMYCSSQYARASCTSGPGRPSLHAQGPEPLFPCQPPLAPHRWTPGALPWLVAEPAAAAVVCPSSVRHRNPASSPLSPTPDEHSYKIPSTSSFRSEPRPNP
jgi:hypothetical protein